MQNLSIEKILSEISHLSSIEKEILYSNLEIEMKKNSQSGHNLDILELRGLGKEIWQGIDAQEYVNKERELWD